MNRVRPLIAMAAGLTVLGTAHATLYDRGGGMIYDSTRNITWLADMNYANTSGWASRNAGIGANSVSFDGRMGWSTAVAWADSLVYGGYSDWRLPTLNPSDKSCGNSFNPGGGFPNQYYGYNCAGGELSGLFVTDLGIKAGESISNTSGDTPEQIANLALFSNLASSVYWSGTPYAPDAASAWYFISADGAQRFDSKSLRQFAVAVRIGDVTPVPEPQSVTLMLAGALLIGFAARRRTES